MFLKKMALREHLKFFFFIVNPQDKGMTNEISLSKDFIDVKVCNNHRVSVF